MIKTSITSSKIHVNDGKIPRNANAKPRNPPNPNKKTKIAGFTIRGNFPTNLIEN